MKKIVFTVTNELNYDQRMIRICTTLANNGYSVTLVGVKFLHSNVLQNKIYNQKRIKVLSKNGIQFYLEYNLKLFVYLLFTKADAYCAIDLDTILPTYFKTIFAPKKRLYDAHEYFSQQKEIISRPNVYKIWHCIEKFCVPKFKQGYTVSNSIATAFLALYKVNYCIIKNVPYAQSINFAIPTPKKIVYQGAVNHARGLEALIPAMKTVEAQLHIYGDGNFLAAAKQLTTLHHLQKKIIFEGKFLPHQLNQITATAYIGINLVENVGLNQYYSLANKFFDYIQFSIPQVTMNYPEYSRINNEYDVAFLINNCTEHEIIAAINTLLNDTVLYQKLKTNCTIAAKALNWEVEEQVLLTFYKNIFE